MLLGKKEARTAFDWPALEGVVGFLKTRDWTEIGGVYDVSAKPGTLDSYLKQFVNRATAGWIAAVFEESGIIEIDRARPARVRLKEGF